eukprot:3029203-Amphidinium_carterae.1
MPHTPHDPRVPSRPMGIQGILDPFDFQNHGGGQGTGNQVLVANNKVSHKYGHPQPREASSRDLPELPTPPKFKSWRSAIRRVVAAASTQPQAAFQWVLMVEGTKPSDPQLAQLPDGFTTLDAKLNAAVWKISHGEVLRRFLSYQVRG